jgi:nucleoside-diphosphate-sugar epimerase
MTAPRPLLPILVTGAAGTVGGYVVRELVARGHHVIVTDRPGARFDFELPDDAPLEVRPGDLTDLGFCVDITAGVGAVVHVAASIDLTMPGDEMRRINVDAVRYLYESARARGARRFVFFSSGSIYRKGHAPIAETSPLDPQTDYERSKADAEAYLWSRPRTGPEVVVLRPTMIYGPRARFLGAKMTAFVPILAEVLGRVPRLRGGPIFNWAHAEDVARAAVFLLDEPRAAWEAYNVADDDALPFGEMIEVITRAYGLPVGPAVPYPTDMLSIVGPRLARRPHLLSAVSRLTERGWRRVVSHHHLEPAICSALDRETFLYAATQAVFDTSKLRALGFRMRWPSFRDGYPDVLRWFQAHRWAPDYQSAHRRANSPLVEATV